MSQKTPSMVMYAAFKQCGISNHDAATVLLNTRLTFDGRMLQERIEESSQLSRRIVRTSPGELSIGLFNDFNFTCPRLANLLVENLALKDHRGNAGEASEALSGLLATTYARSMADALSSFGIDHGRTVAPIARSHPRQP